MSEKYELAIRETIEDRIVSGYGQLLDMMKANNETIYGNIAYSIESHRPEIDKVAEEIATYFATQRALQITKEYEETRSFREKWIKNDALKLKQMEIQREMEMNMVSGGIQLALKGGVFVLEKVLVSADNKKRKRDLWRLCLMYANSITNGDIHKYKLTGLMENIHRQLFGKLCKDFMADNTESSFMPTNQAEAENAALILYYIYMTKHNKSAYFESKEKDFENLMELWMYMGIFGSHAEALIRNYELMEKGRAFEYGRLNSAIQILHNNLLVSIPNIDRSLARRINAELLQYVPNGDKQLACRRTAKFVTKAGITVATSVLGTATANPLLLNVAASSALSLYSDLSKTEIIGNCLRESGIDDSAVKKCIESAIKTQKKLPVVE